MGIKATSYPWAVASTLKSWTKLGFNSSRSELFETMGHITVHALVALTLGEA